MAYPGSRLHRVHNVGEIVVGGKKIFQKTIVQISHMEPLSKKAGIGHRVMYLRDNLQ